VKRKKITPLQNTLLDLLSKNGEPLSYRDLAREVDVSSTNTIAYNLKRLEIMGYLKRDITNPQGFVVMDQPNSGIVHLKLYGLAQCGPKGSLVDGKPIDQIPLDARFIPFPAEDAFLVKAKGDSMEPRIYEGDLILVKKQSTAEDGEIVVCVNDEEGLVKKIKRERGGVILISLNSKYPPFFSSKEFRIEGVVKTIISKTIG
jgi:repressor LexA